MVFQTKKTWMKSAYKFDKICGTVYKRGNLIFSPDGNSLLSSVGNQVSIYDLVKNETVTLPFETRKDIARYRLKMVFTARLALSPTGSLLIAVDVDGMAILINYTKRVLLHHFNFKAKVYDLKFSPDSKLLAVSHGKLVQIWHAPGYTREFAPFVLFKEYPGNYDSVLSITWSKDSKYFLTTGKDLTCRLYAVDSQSFTGACLTGHNDIVIGAWFSHNEKKIYTVSRYLPFS